MEDSLARVIFITSTTMLLALLAYVIRHKGEVAARQQDIRNMVLEPIMKLAESLSATSFLVVGSDAKTGESCVDVLHLFGVSKAYRDASVVSVIIDLHNKTMPMVIRYGDPHRAPTMFSVVEEATVQAVIGITSEYLKLWHIHNCMPQTASL